MATFPGTSQRVSAPYSKSFAAGAASSTSLIATIEQARNATSGFTCLVVATTIQLTYKDCAGNVVDTGSITSVVGQSFEVTAAAIELTTNTGLVVIARWHASTAR